MCGIVGFVNFQNENEGGENNIPALVHQLRHRGPDDKGFYSDNHVSFGHSRLSIIDLQGGQQPIFNEDKSVCVILNGEIYNYKELKNDLKNKHSFSTQTDTEVIVHLWEEYAENCVDYLRGMFAFALYDIKRKKVFLARDRFGQKPLVYAETKDGFYFSSEIYPLTTVSAVNTELNYQALNDFFSLHYIAAPHTIYKGIKKLSPAHYLVITDSGIARKRYWSIQPQIKTRDSYSQAEEKVFDLIKESVRLRLRSDVPVGAFLSGGVDSSIIVAMMRELEPDMDLRTVCIGFNTYIFHFFLVA